MGTNRKVFAFAGAIFLFLLAIFNALGKEEHEIKTLSVSYQKGGKNITYSADFEIFSKERHLDNITNIVADALMDHNLKEVIVVASYFLKLGGESVETEISLKFTRQTDSSDRVAYYNQFAEESPEKPFSIPASRKEFLKAIRLELITSIIASKD